MVTVLPAVERSPTFMQKLGLGVGRGLDIGKQLFEEHQQKEKEQQQKEAIRNLIGEGVENLPSDLQKIALQGQLSQQKEAQKLRGDTEIEQRDYATIQNAFGKNFADIWRSSQPGARTELIKNALDMASRGHNVEELLKNFVAPEQAPSETPTQVKTGAMKPDEEGFQWPDFKQRPKDFTPKDWRDEMKTWRKENSPIFVENKKKLQNIKGDKLATKKLTQLNESRKLPEEGDFSRLLIDPETGDFRGVAQVLGFKSPEAQEWSKVIARFQNRAKDAFGSRVTNFDLQSYMKQFPDLLNTYEGRKRILRMMDINFELDELYDKALQKIYDKYGLDGIPHEKADQLARQFIEDDTNRLEQEFLGLDEENIMESPQKLSGRMVEVIGPSGEVEGEIDESEVGQLPPGFRIR